MTTLVVVGASLAGVQAAQSMRRQGFDGRLVLVGDEPHQPYDRPPLSKEYLTAAEVDEARLRLRPTADPEALGLDWRLGRRAEALVGPGQSAASTDSGEPGGSGRGRLTLDDGEEIAFDGLVVATGARPRRLPGQESADGRLVDGVLELRTLDDARRLRATLVGGGRRVVVCGAGFIGAEVAASARERGLDVTLIDAAEIPMDRVLDAPAGRAVAELHRSHGVDVRLGVKVAAFEPGGPQGRSTGGAVRLADGTAIEADVIVVGIGVVPNTEWLAGSGLTIDDGVLTDATTLAAPGIVAAGDVARWPNPRFGGRLMRVEQWDNALTMGGHAGKRLLAELDGSTPEDRAGAAPYEPVPWFWSDQYDRKIQLAGVTGPHAEVIDGSMGEGRFVQLYGDEDGRLCGALCWNRPRQAVQARMLVADGATVDAARERLA